MLHFFYLALLQGNMVLCSTNIQGFQTGWWVWFTTALVLANVTLYCVVNSLCEDEIHVSIGGRYE